MNPCSIDAKAEADPSEDNAKEAIDQKVADEATEQHEAPLEQKGENDTSVSGNWFEFEPLINITFNMTIN